MKEKTKTFLYNFLNPIVLLFYGVLLYTYYRLSYDILYAYIIELLLFLGSVIIILVWGIVSYMMARENHKIIVFKKYDKQQFYFAISLFVVISCIFGYFAGKLIINRDYSNSDNEYSYVESDIQSIEEMHANLAFLGYKYNFNERSYVDKLELVYNGTGEVQSYHFNVYLEENQRIQCFTFDYTKESQQTKIKISNDNQFNLNSSVLTNYNQMKIMIQAIPISAHLEQNHDYKLEYEGVKNLSTFDIKAEYNFIYFNSDGVELNESDTFETVRLFKQIGYGNIYYAYVNKDSESTEINQSASPSPKSEDSNDEEQSILESGVGYQLVITDAALGSRFYALDKTSDGGKTWNRINDNPFSNDIGVTTGIIFFNDNYGYIGMGNAGGDRSTLYCTRDGGKTFKKVELKVKDGYDYAKLPYQENGRYYIKVQQDSLIDDPDAYMAFSSTNEGKTWVQEK